MKSLNILICICGGIAAYKVANLVSMLQKEGHSLTVLMTENACELISPVSFQSISCNLVHKDLFSGPYIASQKHVHLAKAADFIIVAPATGNIIGKLASGICDDMVSTTIASSNAPVLVVPAMNTIMYKNPIVQSNIDSLKNSGYHFMEPGFGAMSMRSEAHGKGRLPEPTDIFNYVNNFLTELY